MSKAVLQKNYGTDESAAWVQKFPIGSEVYLAEEVTKGRNKRFIFTTHRVVAHNWSRPNDVASNQWCLHIQNIFTVGTVVDAQIWYCDRKKVCANRKALVKTYHQMMRNEIKILTERLTATTNKLQRSI